ncbi:U11/U12 small nuclear ribonucleoprotein 31 kDa protein [Ananas comosus]|uniref:U11/U12 small nuclear ribonucleoprotein 31 kDa protein n=1 Tax=Ananas comosus TaxID=4615 RepID=A0A199URG8_ANACO|nr:U11/U12 small nuclear ribonucleoprotein 31 kDa protein [Ananas comosus]
MAHRGRGIDDDDDEEEDDFVYRYPTPSSSSSAAASSRSKGGSGGLAPSKSTVYVSNLDYSLTNSDLHTIFSTFGKVARVTVLKDRASRRSRGVAFVLFVSRRDAAAAAAAMHGKVLNGRTLSASIASDNGRAAEFIRRRVYRDKSRCYECGEGGHLSYECPRNQLGARERPAPKRGRRGSHGRGGGGGGEGEGGEDGASSEGGEGEEGFEDDNWASVLATSATKAARTIRGLRNMQEIEEAKKRSKEYTVVSDGAMAL